MLCFYLIARKQLETKDLHYVPCTVNVYPDIFFSSLRSFFEDFIMQFNQTELFFLQTVDIVGFIKPDA